MPSLKCLEARGIVTVGEVWGAYVDAAGVASCIDFSAAGSCHWQGVDDRGNAQPGDRKVFLSHPVRVVQTYAGPRVAEEDMAGVLAAVSAAAAK